MVGIGCVDIVHAPINGVPDHTDGFGFVDILALGDAVAGRQAHAAEAEDRNRRVEFPEFPILHAAIPRIQENDYTICRRLGANQG